MADQQKLTGDETISPARRIIEAAFKSGLIDPKIPASELVNRFTSDLEQVAGYVCAWDKYVLVVGKEELNPEIRFRRG